MNACLEISASNVLFNFSAEFAQYKTSNKLCSVSIIYYVIRYLLPQVITLSHNLLDLPIYISLTYLGKVYALCSMCIKYLLSNNI